MCIIRKTTVVLYQISYPKACVSRQEPDLDFEYAGSGVTDTKKLFKKAFYQDDCS